MFRTHTILLPIKRRHNEDHVTCLVWQLLAPCMNSADFRHYFKANVQFEVIFSKTYL